MCKPSLRLKFVFQFYFYSMCIGGLLAYFCIPREWPVTMEARIGREVLFTINDEVVCLWQYDYT